MGNGQVIYKKIMAVFLVVVMVLGLVSQPLGKNGKVEAEDDTTLLNPRVTDSDTTWDCVELGVYPQTEVVLETDTVHIAKLNELGVQYETVNAQEWEQVKASARPPLCEMETEEEKIQPYTAGEYVAVTQQDAVAVKTDAGSYGWGNSSEVRYFKCEPIKWRVTGVSTSTAALVTDQVLDTKYYSWYEEYAKWDSAGVRVWLNGTAGDVTSGFADNNTYRQYCKNYYFYDTAFSAEEQAAIRNNAQGGKIRVLYKRFLGLDYFGFNVSDAARHARGTAFSVAMGGNSQGGYSDWWLEDSGKNESDELIDNYVAYVEASGKVNATGKYVGVSSGSQVNQVSGIRPFIEINLRLLSSLTKVGTVNSEDTIGDSGDSGDADNPGDPGDSGDADNPGDSGDSGDSGDADNPDDSGNSDTPSVTDGYSVTIVNPYGSHITKGSVSGAESQTGLKGAMDKVFYYADAGYCFPSSYQVETANGIKVTRSGDKTLVVSGTPTANTKIILPAAVKVDSALYKVTVINGTGSDSYAAGMSVGIEAEEKEGKRFTKWIVKKGNVNLVNAANPSTTFVMTAEEVEIEACYEDKQTSGSPSVPASPANPSTSGGNTTVTTVVVTPVSPETVKQNSKVLNTKAQVVWKNNTLQVKWGKTAGADGYDVFAAEGKTKLTAKHLAASFAGKDITSGKIKKAGGRKLDTKKTYAVKIKAYRLANGLKEYIGESLTLYVAGSQDASYTNAGKITLSKTSLSLNKGDSTAVKAVVVKEENNKKLLSEKYAKSLRYITSNEKIAKVDKNGKIKALKKGKCSIYVIAQNGVKAKISVKVK